MAVGMAMAVRHLADTFNTAVFPIVDHFTYALVGDWCLKEGVSSEAGAMAGTLVLGKLIVLSDSNNIPIEECSKRGIVVFNTPGANANAVAELVVWQSL